MENTKQLFTLEMSVVGKHIYLSEASKKFYDAAHIVQKIICWFSRDVLLTLLCFCCTEILSGLQNSTFPSPWCLIPCAHIFVWLQK